MEREPGPEPEPELEPEPNIPTERPPPYSPPVYVTPSSRPNVFRPPSIFGPNPMELTCSNCQKQVTTSVVHEFGSCTIIAAVTVFVFFFPCFWLPLVMDICKDVHHTCPSCNSLLGTYKVI